MKVSVTNFAQIDKAKDIQIKNLTVLIGKNGSGKTYFAKLIYFLNDFKIKIQVFDKHFQKKAEESFTKKEKIHFTKEEQELYFNKVCIHVKNQFHDLIGSRKELFKSFGLNASIEMKELEFEYDDQMLDTTSFNDYFRSLTAAFILNIFPIAISHYLPAARANYMITYKYLFDSQFNNLKDFMLNKSSIKRFTILPEAENAFLSDIYKVNTKENGPFYKFAGKIEKEIFKNGRLSIRNPRNEDLPTYEYKINNLKESIDLVSTSSAITELSPLIMYLRHKISEGNNELLIIDEPELSLHPSAQAQLISILVEAVNQGLKLLLVTHSPYILESLNNHLMRGKIDNLDLSKEIKSIPPLNFNDVAAYLFENNTIITLLDLETKLINDKLLNTFKDINKFYEKMRDYDWNANIHD